MAKTSIRRGEAEKQGRGLFFKQPLEGSSRIIRCLGGPSNAGRGGLLFHARARLKEGALIAGILTGNTLLDGLCALETAVWVKVDAILAAMERGGALWALAVKRHVFCGRQSGPAHGAAKNGDKARHFRGARRRRVSGRPGCRLRFVVRTTVVVLITVLAVLTGHKK